MKSALKTTVIIFLSIASITIMQSCKKEYTPTVHTDPDVLLITQTSALPGGYVIDDGGAEVTERGICYSTTHNPTINSSKAYDDSFGRLGPFSKVITDLTPNTTYYFRAYATNSVGTGYGDELSFKTSESGKGIQKSNFQGGKDPAQQAFL